jgi:hypothetical protein
MNGGGIAVGESPTTNRKTLDGLLKWSDSAAKWLAGRQKRRPAWPLEDDGALPKIMEFADLLSVAKVAQNRFWCRANDLGLKPRWNRLQIAKFGQPIWFRGDCVFSKSKLQPHVYKSKYKPTGNADKSPEKFMLRKFQREAIARRDNCPRDDQLALWMCLAQHWGLPTRLLDWTESILNAAYFAANGRSGKNETDCVIWALSPALLNWHFVNNGPIFALNDDEDVGTLVHAAFEGLSVTEAIDKRFPKGETPCKNEERRNFFDNNGMNADSPRGREAGAREKVVLACNAPMIDTRMDMQQAAFTIHVSGNDLADCGTKQESLFLMKFAIDSGSCLRIVEDLARVGVHRATIFPDLQNLAKDIADGWASRINRFRKKNED